MGFATSLTRRQAVAELEPCTATILTVVYIVWLVLMSEVVPNADHACLPIVTKARSHANPTAVLCYLMNN